MLVLDADWEIALKAGWSIECLCPPAVLAQLELDLLAERVRAIEIGIKWTAGLVRDEHAPPAVPTVWGLYTISGQPQSLRGHMTSIDWHVVPGAAVHSKDPLLDKRSPKKASRILITKLRNCATCSALPSRVFRAGLHSASLSHLG